MSPRRSAPTRKQPPKRGLPTWAILAGAGVIVVIALAVGIDFLSKGQTPTPVPTSLSSSGIPQAGRTLGDPNAPINLVDFSDFQ